MATPEEQATALVVDPAAAKDHAETEKDTPTTRTRKCLRRNKWTVRAAAGTLTIGLGLLIAWFVLIAVYGRAAPDYDLRDPARNGTAWPVYATPEVVTKWQTELPLGVTVIDARAKPNFFAAETQPGARSSIHGSSRAYWTDFAADGGILKPDDELAVLFAQRGVSPSRPVVVYGGWTELWGEEGRIYWQLDYLGHKNVSILYGGIFAWDDFCKTHRDRCSAYATASDEKRGLADPAGGFVAKTNSTLRVSHNDVVRLDNLDPVSTDTRVLILDARERNEYDGATPYGSAYGGHIPNALSVPWNSVFAKDGSGNIAQPSELWDIIRTSTNAPSDLPATYANLTAAARTKTFIFVTYCTGGVRSAFLYAALKWAAFPGIVTNYDGSWWDWSKKTPKP